MADFHLGVALFVLATVAVGLIRVLHGPARADRMMAAQLLGSGGVAALLLMATGINRPALVDVSLLLALLAPFASVAFVISGAQQNKSRSEPGQRC